MRLRKEKLPRTPSSMYIDVRLEDEGGSPLHVSGVVQYISDVKRHSGEFTVAEQYDAAVNDAENERKQGQSIQRSHGTIQRMR
jgi:hypothetical protein